MNFEFFLFRRRLANLIRGVNLESPASAGRDSDGKSRPPFGGGRGHFPPLLAAENSAMTVICCRLSHALAGVDRSGRGCNPRPAQRRSRASRDAFPNRVWERQRATGATGGRWNDGNYACGRPLSFTTTARRFAGTRRTKMPFFSANSRTSSSIVAPATAP